MFYELLNFNNDFDLIKLNNNISNKFFTLILIGIDSNYLDLNDIDINKTTEYYFNKINNLTLSKFNENFNKTNIYHLELLTNILKINLVIKIWMIE